jgi:flagellar hook assembly protein FlgD
LTERGVRLRASPNPFREETTLAMRLDSTARVRLTVVDVAGRRVREIDAGIRGAGEHAISWDGRDERGRAVSAGPYFVRLSAGEERATERVVRIR